MRRYIPLKLPYIAGHFGNSEMASESFAVHKEG